MCRVSVPHTSQTHSITPCCLLGSCVVGSEMLYIDPFIIKNYLVWIFLEMNIFILASLLKGLGNAKD